MGIVLAGGQGRLLGPAAIETAESDLDMGRTAGCLAQVAPASTATL